MGTVIDTDYLQKKRAAKHESEDQRIRLLIDRTFSAHKDYGLIRSLLDEYGPATMVGVIRSTYNPTFAY